MGVSLMALYQWRLKVYPSLFLSEDRWYNMLDDYVYGLKRLQKGTNWITPTHRLKKGGELQGLLRRRDRLVSVASNGSINTLNHDLSDLNFSRTKWPVFGFLYFLFNYLDHYYSVEFRLTHATAKLKCQHLL